MNVERKIASRDTIKVRKVNGYGSIFEMSVSFEFGSNGIEEPLHVVVGVCVGAKLFYSIVVLLQEFQRAHNLVSFELKHFRMTTA